MAAWIHRKSDPRRRPVGLSRNAALGTAIGMCVAACLTTAVVWARWARPPTPEHAQLILFLCLLAIWPASAASASSLANLLQRLSGSDRVSRKILLLRKFDVENRGRYSVIKLFRSLAHRGHAVITLKDRTVYAGESASEQMSWFFNFLIMLLSVVFPSLIFTFAYALLLLAILMNVEAPSWLEDFTTSKIGFVVFLTIFMIPTFLFIRMCNSLMDRALDNHAYVMDVVPHRLRSLVDRLLVRRVKGRFSDAAARAAWRSASGASGLHIVVGDDENWRDIVRRVGESAEMICMDLGGLSDHVREEISYMAEWQNRKIIIFMATKKIPFTEEIAASSHASDARNIRLATQPNGSSADTESKEALVFRVMGRADILGHKFENVGILYYPDKAVGLSWVDADKFEQEAISSIAARSAPGAAG